MPVNKRRVLYYKCQIIYRYDENDYDDDYDYTSYNNTN